MVKNNAITLYLPEEDEAKISRASKKISLSKAAFCRTLAVKEADRILKENIEEKIQNG